MAVTNIWHREDASMSSSPANSGITSGCRPISGSSMQTTGGGLGSSQKY